MDEFGVLDRLLFNRASSLDAEPIARILGMVHLYRASGVHLLAFFTFLEWVVEKLFRNLGLSAEKSRLTGFALCLCSMVWIWHLQEFRVTLIRPILTFLIRFFIQKRGAIARIGLPLLLTFLSEFVLSKSTSFTEGALHYYLSVAGGLFAYHLKRESSFTVRHLALAIGSWLPMAVISLAIDHVVSYLTPLYSLITLPVISIFLYPFTLCDFLFHHSVSPITVSFWNLFLRPLFLLPDCGPRFAGVSAYGIWVALPIAILVSFFWRSIPHRSLSFVILLLGLMITRSGLAQIGNVHEVIQLDVHQGDGSIIRDRGIRTEMVDVGSLKTYSAEQWLDKLALHDVQSIDGILLSHLDEDHEGALKELLLLVPIHCIETNGEHWQSEKGIRLASFIHENAPETKLQTSGCIRLSEVAWFRSARSSGNELMGGIAYAPNDHEVYLALGDGDEEQELAYEAHFKSVIDTHPVRIWKIGHHGSRFSSNLGFLERLDPKEFWISVGRRNPYHHPSVLTLEKLTHLTGKIHRTDVEGDITRSFKE